MENKYIKRINTIGKVSKVIVIIAEILIICGIVGSIIGSIACMMIPDGMVKVDGNVNAELIIDTDKVPFLINIDEDIEDLEELDNLGSIDGLSIGSFIKDLKFNVDSQHISDSELAVSLDAGIENIETSSLKWILAGTCLGAALVMGAALVIAIFGQKLASAFAKCSSPFEENVIKRMKRFAYSMIPWAVISCLTSDSITLTAVLLTAVVILFVQIFSYGAKLQQESDDTI